MKRSPLDCLLEIPCPCPCIRSLVVSGGQAGQGVTSESTTREPETIRADESFHGVVHPTNPSIIGGGPQPIPHSTVPSDKLVEFFTFLLYLPPVHV